MGKYDNKSLEDSIESWKWVANELAEANRLKRIEIDCKYNNKYFVEEGDSIIVRVPKEELEDKA